MTCCLASYRARVGTWAARLGIFRNAAMQASAGGVGNSKHSQLLCASILAILLLIAGIEQNPGPGAETAVDTAMNTCRKCERSERRLRRLEAQLEEAHKSIGELTLKLQVLEQKHDSREGQETAQPTLDVARPNEAQTTSRMPTERPFERKVKVFGDSMLRHSGGVCHAKGADVAFYPGADVNNMTKVIEKVSNDDSVEVVLVHVGTNSSKRQPVFRTVRQCVRLGQTVKKKFKNAQVIFSGIVCRKDVHNRKIWDLNRHIFRACESFDGLFVDPNFWLHHEDLARDGLHLNQKGAWKLGRLHDDVIRSSLRLR